MTTTLIDILDSAVKIGLGAAITAFAAYKSNRLNHVNDRTREIRSHKLKTIESIADKCDTYFLAYTKLHNRLEGIRKKHNRSGELPLSAEQQQYIKECDKELHAAFEGASSARARLRLLQAFEAEKILREIGERIADYRNKIIFDKALPPQEVAEKHIEEFIGLRRKFDDALGNLYSQL